MKKELESYFSKRENEDKKTKSLLSFLTQTLDKVKTGSKEAIQEAKVWLSEHAESTKEYLSQNGSKLAQKTLRTLGALVICTSLMLNIAGCDNKIPMENITTRPIEEIEQTGITSDDVLALYDNLCEFIAEAHYGTFDSLSKEQVDSIEGNFVDFNTVRLCDSTSGKNVFRNKICYHEEPDFYPYGLWLDSAKSPYFIDNIEPMNGIYTISLHSVLSADNNQEDYYCDQLGVEKDAMENLLKAFNVKQFKLTEDMMNGDTIRYVDYSAIMGTEVYEPTKITRELIKNANEDQLWALYNMVDSIISINFYNELPKNDVDYDCTPNQ